MQNKVFKIFLLFSLIFTINSCTSEPNPPLSSGYVYLDKTFIELPETAILNVSSQSSMVMVTNVGEGNLLFNFDSTDTADAFTYTTTCTGFLNVGDSCTIIFQFAPNRVGAYDKIFKIINTVDGNVTNLNLKGKAVANTYEPAEIPGLVINSNVINFPDQALNTRSVIKDIELKNTTTNLITLNYSIEGNIVNTTAFIVKSTCIQGKTLGALESCKFSVAFVPYQNTRFIASINIETSPTVKVTIPIQGNGVIQESYPEQTGIPGLTINTLNLNYYEGNIDNQSNPKYLTFTNNTATNIDLKYTDPTNDAFALRALGTTCFFDNTTKVITVLSADSCNVALNFMPKATNSYSDKIDFTYLNKSFTVTLEGKGQNVSTGAVFGYVSPALFSSTSAPVYKKVIFLNSTPYTVQTSNIAIISYNKDNTTQLDNESVFRLEDNASCENIVLGPYQSCSLNVAFYVDQTVTPMPTPQAYHGEITFNSAFGGVLGTLNVTGTTSQSSASSLAEYNIPNMDINIMTSSATIGQKIYFYGGKFDDATTASLLRYYDYSNNKVVTLNPSGKDMVRSLGEKRPGYLSSVNMMAYNGKIIIYGGKFRVNYTGSALDPNRPDEDALHSSYRTDDIYIYDPNDRALSNDGAWKVVKAKSTFIPVMMVGSASTIYNDKIYFFGGKNYNNTPIDESTRFKTYNLSSNEWENITSKISNLDDTFRSRVFSAMTVFNNVLYIYGGTSNIDDFLNYNKDMYVLNFATQTETTVGDIMAFEPGGTTPGLGSMIGDQSTCLYRESGDVAVTEIGPCRPYRLKLVNGESKIFTTTGIDNATGSGILGPWGFLPDIDNSIGTWTNYETTYGLRLPAFEILTSIDGVVTGIGGDKLYLFNVN